MSLYHEPFRHILPKVEVYFQGRSSAPTVYDNAKVSNIRVLEELSDERGAVSANEIVVTLDNTDGALSPTVNPLVTIGLPVDVSLGIYNGVDFTYTSFGGTYLVQDIDAPTGAINVVLVLNDLMFTIGDKDIPALPIHTNVTLGSLFESVFALAGLTSAQYTICASSYDLVLPYAWTNGGKVRNVLQKLSEAGNKHTYVGRDGKIHVADIMVSGIPYATAFTASNQIIDVQQSPKYSSLFSEAVVRSYQYTQKIVDDTLTLKDVSVPGSLERVKTNAPMVHVNRVDITKGTSSFLTALSYSAEEINMTLDSELPEVVDVAINCGVLESVSKDVVRTNPSIPTENSFVVDNSLIQSDTYAGTYADAMLVLKSDPLAFISMDVRGNPTVVLGQHIVANYPKYQINNQELVVHRMTLSYDGGLEGKIEGYRVVV